jgi:N-acetylglutamate synthase
MIRKLTIENYGALIALWVEAGLEYRPDGRDAPEAIRNQMIRNPEMFWGYFYQGKLAGSLLVSHDGRKGWINRIAIKPEFQRRGIARELLQFAEKQLAEKGIRIFAALIYDDNIPSLNLFEKSGYEICPNIVYLRRKCDDKV